MALDPKIQSLRTRLLGHTTSADLAHPEKGGIRCTACGHRCFIPEGRDGVCKVRSNVSGELRVPWGYVGGLQVDPIEKKPFFHVLPGTDALSFGMLGCDFRCRYCQNWMTSQTLRDPASQVRPESITSEEILTLAREHGARSVVSTYNEPLITAEWGRSICARAKAEGLVTGFVSNGNATPEVLSYLRPFVDLYKVDLKGFRDRPYRELGGVLANVTRSIESIYAQGFWLEIVTLLVPGLNDGKDEIRDLIRFIHGLSPSIPWHVTGFHGDYRMQDRKSTEVLSLVAAAEMAREIGLEFVYVGNRHGRVGDWESTFCPGCGDRVIHRQGFRVREVRLEEGACLGCGYSLPGQWAAPPRPPDPKAAEANQAPTQTDQGRALKESVGPTVE